MKVYVLCDVSSGPWEYEGVFATVELAKAAAPKGTEWTHHPPIFADSEPIWRGVYRRQAGGQTDYEIVETEVIGLESES